MPSKPAKAQSQKGKPKPKGAKPKASNGSTRTSAPVGGGWTVPVGARTRAAPLQAAKAAADATMCCGLVNPWHVACFGMKFPDGNNGRSMTSQLKGLITMTGANVCNSFLPVFPYGYLTSTYSSPTYSFASTYSEYSVPSIFTSNAVQVRLVCGAIKVAVSSAVTNSQGTLTVARNNTYTALSGTRTSGALDDEYAEVYPVATGATWVIPFKRSALPLFNNISTASLTGVTGSPNYETITLELNGGVSGTTLSVEYVFNIEWNYTASSGLGHVSTRDPRPQPKAIEAASKALDKMPPVVNSTVDQFGKLAEKAALSAMQKGGEFLLEGLASLF